MIISGTPYVLTAGHCFAKSASVSNELYDTDTSMYEGTGNSMGTVDGQDTTSDGTDTAYLSGAGSDLLWIGAIGSPVSETVHAVAGVTDGETGLCSSGALDGQICSLTAGTLDNCISTYYYNSSWVQEDKTACDLIYVKNTHETGGVHDEAAFGQGDSGGPMYLVSSGDYDGIGLIEAGVSGDNVTCPANAWSGRICTWDGYYTSLSATLNFYGGTLATG